MAQQGRAKVSTNRKGSGQRRRYRGRTVGPTGSPRSSTHGGKSPNSLGWTVNDTHDARFGKTGIPTNAAGLGPYRVQMPAGRTRYIEPVR